MAATHPIDPMQEKVSIHIPKASGDEPILFVGLNGKNWTIPRGKTVEVPKPVADIIYDSLRNVEAEDNFRMSQQKLMNVVQGAE